MILTIEMSQLSIKIFIFLVLMETGFKRSYAIEYDVFEECSMDLAGIATKYGYYVENHVVVTEDKYILKLFRMPRMKNSNTNNRIPVFLMHGIGGTADDWVMNLPNIGLAYILADAGYDVWMGNARGNFYSKKHITLSPNSRDFWSFSWHEIGLYDLPAMIDYALLQNGMNKLHYIGHSQGTTSFFVMCSMRPQYNDKIITMNAYAPVTILLNNKNPLSKSFATYGGIAQELLTTFSQGEILARSNITKILISTICSTDSSTCSICKSLFPENGLYVNLTRIPIFFSHIPSGMSFKQVSHYTQSVTSGKFAQYDYGAIINSFYYKTPNAPLYDLSLVVVPVAFHISDNDEWVTEIDATILYNKMKNRIGMFKLTRPSFNHADYTLASDAKTQVYDKTISIMKQYD